jgi:hypothetical protein
MPETNTPQVEITTKNTVALTLGIISTVIGVIALLIGWVPFLGLFAIPGAVIGLILALIGGITAIAKKGKGIGLPILGGVICLCAFILPIASTGGFSSALADARKKQTQDAKVTVVPAAEATPGPAAATPQAPTPAPESPKIVWNDGLASKKRTPIQAALMSFSF